MAYYKVILVITTIFIFTQAALAFSDIKGTFVEKEILDLKERGIIKGYEDGTFVPGW
ncbi:S-layer homology domain-containing protein [Anaerobacillus sp. HL2]|nr:S-layer homology domain-containing protein [Anaerobacillus sp. HL2]